MKTSWFQVAEQKSPPTKLPFLLVEVNMTSDGPRSRICNGRYKTLEDAETEMRLRVKLNEEVKTS